MLLATTLTPLQFKGRQLKIMGHIWDIGNLLLYVFFSSTFVKEKPLHSHFTDEENEAQRDERTKSQRATKQVPEHEPTPFPETPPQALPGAKVLTEHSPCLVVVTLNEFCLPV